ncbi:hypothetical protein J5N97_022113 [Dioscorea zingiberensis]|uniref:Bidirectional sugar transporter SWEET n=1 Tax=Dioscorea zingiberensis TaxID=325984 RepID=A0A9D5C9Y4_9LILI|nr:hypothetical protein J5N97_022113 [Dioscorea zingiberensis]
MTKKNVVVLEVVAIAVAEPHGSAALFPYPPPRANGGGSAGSFGIGRKLLTRLEPGGRINARVESHAKATAVPSPESASCWIVKHPSALEGFDEITSQSRWVVEKRETKMGGLLLNGPWSWVIFLIAIIGAVISIMMHLAPLITFYGVYVEGWIEGLTPVPYSISIFTCILRIYYALLSGYVPLLIINMVGFIFSTIYITIYLFFAPKKDKVPNALSLMFGVIQMVFYMKYKDVDSTQQTEELAGAGENIEMVE